MSFSIPSYELLLKLLLSIVPNIVISGTVVGGFTRRSTRINLTLRNVSNIYHCIVDADITVENVVLFKEHHEGWKQQTSLGA